MATTRKPFGNRKSAEGIAANAKAATPVTRPVAPAKPSTRSTPSNSTATPNKAPAAPARATGASAVDTAVSQNDLLEQGKANAQTFMQIISGMPVETKNRYLSAFTDFLALPIDQQSSYLAGLEQTAKDIVEPAIKQRRERQQEDYEYDKQKIEREKTNLQITFNQVVRGLDLNKNRDIAKENQTAAKTMQNVGNTAFVTNVAGAGIFSRRTAYVRENLQNNVEDITVNFNQKMGEATTKKGLADIEFDSELDRLFQLNERDVTDLDQTQKQDELSMFLELAGSKFGQKGQQNAALLEAGTNTDLGKDEGSAATDFSTGGTDTQRRARYQSELKAKKDAEEAQARREHRLAVEAASKKYGELTTLEAIAGHAGRQGDVEKIRAELNNTRALAGENQWLDQNTQGALESNLRGMGLLYGGSERAGTAEKASKWYKDVYSRYFSS